MARPHEAQNRTFSEHTAPQPEQVTMPTDCTSPLLDSELRPTVHVSDPSFRKSATRGHAVVVETCMVRRRTARRIGFDENSLRKCIRPLSGE